MVKLKNKHPYIKSIYSILHHNRFFNAHILDITKLDHLISVSLLVPNHKEINELIELIPNMQQELNATDAKIHEIKGKKITILFGKSSIEPMQFNKSHISYDSLKVCLPSSFGNIYLDFADGASCHLLNAGVTRMGKTTLLLYLSTLLYIQTKGNIELYITSTKLKDYYPFNNVKNVYMSRTDKELDADLDKLLLEYKLRDARLYSKALEKATDAKSVLKLYPNQYKYFKPIFLIIDEYARFSEKKEIQKKVQELVETAGYVNIHIIVSTQRPDARTVLPARIKGNLLARICFTTTDENNSKLILDRGGAEHLGKIPGRALYLDSDINTVQIPYLKPIEAHEMLQLYREEEQHENTNESNKGETRPIDNKLTNKIQNLFKESDSNFNL